MTPHALVSLTKSDGSGTIYVNSLNIVKVNTFTSSEIPSANADVIYSAPSAFLGDQTSVIADELPANIASASALPSTGIISVTVAGVAVYLNVYNILSVVSDGGSGSKIQYKEFGVVTYIFCSESPSTVQGKF